MSNLNINNVDLGSVELEDGKFRDEIVTFAGADTFLAGTLFARRAVALAVTASAVIGGTGTGTCTLATVIAGPVVPLVGVYTLRLMTVVTHGGIWQLEDPNGNIVATRLEMTAGSGAATAFKVAGLGFTITDATDFIVGNTFTLTVAADGKMVPYSPTGAGGVQFPRAVLTDDLTKASSGDLASRLLVGGKVNRNRLIIDADGDGDNITNAILDQLRSYGIFTDDVDQLSTLDNQ